jgi:hypothetical protein
MTPSPPVLRVVSATASAAVLAISVGLFPGGPAAADSTEPSAGAAPSTQAPAGCQLLCLPVLGEEMSPPETERPRKAKEPVAPPGQPAAPAPAAPNQPAEPAAPPAATVPAPAAPSAVPAPEAADSGQAPPETAAPASSTPPSNGTAGASNWNTPVTRSAKATQVAAVAPVADPGADDPAPLPIIAGVLLVGAAGVAFAWWGRNRLRAH